MVTNELVKLVKIKMCNNRLLFLHLVVRGPGWRAVLVPEPLLREEPGISVQLTVMVTTVEKKKVSARLAEERPSSTHSPFSPAQCVLLHLTVGKTFLNGHNPVHWGITIGLHKINLVQWCFSIRSYIVLMCCRKFSLSETKTIN